MSLLSLLSWQDGDENTTVTVQPPAIQRWRGPYGNAFYGVQPTFSRNSASADYDLDPNWLRAVVNFDITICPPESLQRRPHVNLCSCLAEERAERIDIVDQESSALDRILPWSPQQQEGILREQIEQEALEEMCDAAWQFIYNNDGSRRNPVIRNALVGVKTITDVRLRPNSFPYLEFFPGLEVTKTHHWLALQVLRRADNFEARREPRNVVFGTHSVVRRHDEIHLDPEDTYLYLGMAPRSSFGYLINMKRWGGIRTEHSYWVALWDEPRSLGELRLVTDDVPGLRSPQPHFVFDESFLFSHREESRFVNAIAPLTLEEFHWRARCLSPGAGCVWSPENDKYWPMLFRKIIQYCLQIRVAAGVSGVGHLPHEVVAIVGSFL